MKLLQTINGEQNSGRYYKLDVDEAGPFALESFFDSTFRFNLNIANFKRLLGENNLESGVCQDKLVFIENEEGQLELTSEKGSAYKEAARKKLTLRDINMGDEVELLGYPGNYIYFGTVNYTCYNTDLEFSEESIRRTKLRVFVCFEDKKIFISDKTPTILNSSSYIEEYSNIISNFKLLKTGLTKENGFEFVKFNNDFSKPYVIQDYLHSIYSIHKTNKEDFKKIGENT